MYYLTASLFQVLLAYLIVRSGRQRTIRTAFGLVIGLTALQTLNLLGQNLGVFYLPATPRKFLDSAILLTLGYLIAQFPTPLGGDRGARLSKRLWIGALVGWGLLSPLLTRTVGMEHWLWNLGRDVFHEGAFALTAALFTLHFVPRWFETEQGPLRTQALFAGIGLAVSVIEFGTVDAIRAVQNPQNVPVHLGRALHNVTAWFVGVGILRMLYQTYRRRDPEAWLFAGLVLAAAGLGVHQASVETPGVVEMAAHVFRPILLAMALLRFELIDVPEVERRWAVPTTAVAFAGLTFLMLLGLLSPAGLDAESIRPARATVAVLVVGVLAWSARGWLVDRFDPAVAAQDRGRALQRYRLELERAGKSLEKEELAPLRDELGVTDTEHELIATLVQRGDVLETRRLRAAQPGDVIGDRFEVERELGRGGQGRALAAWDPERDRQVVLKEVLRPWEEGAGRRREALEREVEFIGALDEPGLARVHGIVEEGPRVYLVRSYVSGPTLENLVEEEGPLAEQRAARIAAEIAQSVQHLHEEGLLHLDLKPSNIVLREGEAPVVIDHGTIQQAAPVDEEGRERDRTRTMVSSSPAGTLAWMAPEQLLEEPLDARADVFALGALLYYMLTGEHHVDLDQPAFRVQDEIVQGSPPDDLDGPLGEATVSALARDPGRRPDSMQGMIELLGPVETYEVPSRRSVDRRTPSA